MTTLSTVVTLANPRRLAYEALAEIWKPPPPVDYESWAIDNISFTDRESQFPGPFNPDIFPYFSEIYRALGPDDPCRIVTVKASAQVGKTILATVFTLGSLDLDPCDFLFVHPTEENARRWSKLKLKAMLDASPRMRELFPEKSRDGGDSMLFKERADGRGSLLISGANSPASLSQVSMRRQVQDDLAKWETNAAGDPEDQANSRSRAFEFAKVLKISTPLVAPGCRITRNFEQGSQESFFVPCPHCGHEQTLDAENFIANIDEENPEKSCFSCIECGGLIQEHHRREMLRRGRWIARNPKAIREHRSFYIWSAYSLLQSFERIAREWLAARGSPDKEKVVANDNFGQAYRVKGEAPPWEDLRNRGDAIGHRRGTIPADGLVLTLGVDVNGDWLNWQLLAWTRDGRRHVVDYGRIDGLITAPETHAKLDALLASKWRHESGRELGADLLGIDGNAWTEDVWDWAKRHPMSKVVMLRGVDGDNQPLIARVKKERHRKTGKLLKYSSRFYNFATSILKWSLYRNLPKSDPLERGFVGLPVGMGDDYYKELTAERRVEKKKVKDRTGFSVYEWIKDPGQRNEALDTMVQAEAAAIKFGVRDMPPATWDRYEAERAGPIVHGQLDLEDMLHRTPSPSAAAQAAPAPAKAAGPKKLSDFAARLGKLGQ
jgi:phage terminase large subunit GpA-like protein